MTASDEMTTAAAALKEAMRHEKEGQGFYLKAAKAVDDDSARKAFTDLASDEMSHFNMLKRQYDALTEGGQWADLAKVRGKRPDLSKPLFPKGLQALRQAIKSKSSYLDALLFALDIENRSYDQYREAAEHTSSSQGKEMYEFLAAEERRHFDLLMIRYEAVTGSVGWSA